MNEIIRVGITHGDINGIGYELIIKLLSDPELIEFCTPVVFGSQKLANFHTKSMKLEPINFNIVNNPDGIIDYRANLVNVLEEDVQVTFGQQTEESLQAEKASMNAAIQAWKDHKIDVLIAAPYSIDENKDIPYPTLKEELQQVLGWKQPVYDILVGSKGFRLAFAVQPAVAPESDDASATQAPLTVEDTFKAIKQLYDNYRAHSAEIRPRIAVLANQGLTEDMQPNEEDNKIIRSAIENLLDQDITVFGPFDLKTYFDKCMYRHYDLTIAMQYEPVLDEFCKLDIDREAYCCFAGLPIICASPLVDPSYNLAGRGEATTTTALRKALYSAIDTYRANKAFLEATHDPILKQWVPKGRDDFKLDLTKDD